MDEIRLLIVDQHPVVEEGLEFFLEDRPDISIAAAANSGMDGLEALREAEIDVVVLDLALPGLDGVETIRLYLEQQPELSIVVYSGQGDEASVFRALKAGARGYILKSSPLSELVDAIIKVHQGGYVLSPSLNPAIIEFYLNHRDQEFDELAEYQGLTGRERQVFRLLAKGKQTRDIAEILCISPKTVAKHRVAIKKKLKLKTVAEMAQYAIRLGLVSVEEV